VLITALVAVGLCALGGFLWTRHFFQAYLVAYLYWLGISLGCLTLLMLQHITRGRWGLVLRHILEAGSRTLPLCAALFLPLLLGLFELYPWTQEIQLGQQPTHRQEEIKELIEHKQGYLNVAFFLLRAVIYFGIWIVLAVALNRLAGRNQEQPSAPLRQQMRTISGPGLGLYALTVSLAAVDWVMSMEPLWYSTIFGVVLAVSQLLPGMAFAVTVLIWLSARPDVATAMDEVTWGDLGNLLLAFNMLWAYIGFSQFFLIWNGNLPAEVTWYSHRAWGVWEVLAWALIILYFCTPFALLLSRDLKRQPRRLLIVTGIILVMAYVQYYWLVMPAPSSVLEGDSSGQGDPFYPLLLWLDAAAFVAIGGLWLSWFLWQLQARPLLPYHELARVEEVQHA
jgi:hypothetical protein